MTYAGYQRIQRISLRLFYTWRRKVPIPYANEDCAVCGDGGDTPDHRNYSDALNVQRVCGSCNKKLGPGAVDFWNVETLEMIRVKYKRVKGGRHFHREWRAKHGVPA